MKLQNYALGKWTAGAEDGQTLYNAINGDAIATASSKGLDFAEMMTYARKVGGPALRKMTFQERGRMLKALALFLMRNSPISPTLDMIASFCGALLIIIYVSCVSVSMQVLYMKLDLMSRKTP
jgi:hypothetical protein